jgi:hypothetical protein
MSRTMTTAPTIQIILFIIAPYIPTSNLFPNSKFRGSHQTAWELPLEATDDAIDALMPRQPG